MFCLTVSFPRRGGEVDAEVRRSVIGEMERGSPADNKRGGVRCPWVRVCGWGVYAAERCEMGVCGSCGDPGVVTRRERGRAGCWGKRWWSC